MRYLKLFESFEDESTLQSYIEIKNIRKKYSITDYVIKSDGSIDMKGDVYLYSKLLTKLPLKFNKVEYFDCSHNLLTSLEGSPIEANQSFYCNSNRLTSFQYAPKIIRGGFYCENNEINSFEYFPSYVGGGFDCIGNPIFQVWRLFADTTKIELLNDFDIFRDEDTDTPAIVMDRLNDFLLTIGRDPVEKILRYKNI